MSKFEDIKIGSKFGQWTVLNEAKSVNGRMAYLCRCVCGKEKSVLAAYLLEGRSKSCGCVNNRLSGSMIGNKYGKLTVIDQAPLREKSRKLRYYARCECGNIIDVEGSRLRNGKKVDCGCGTVDRKREACPRYVDIAGQKFGRLTAIERAYDANNNYVGWLCKCECGNTITVPMDRLKRGGTKSCGCYKKDYLSETLTIDETGNTYGFLKVERFSHKNDKGAAYWECKCLNCGRKTIVHGVLLRNGNTKSCGCIASTGETVIRNTLQNRNINYKPQHWFSDLLGTGGRVLKFDFAILNGAEKLQCLVEFDGEFHFDTKHHGWNTPENFEKVQTHDRLKNDYCAKHHIPLIRIPYTDLPKLQASDDYLLSLLSPYLKSIPA